jgi:3-oxoacyl-[acyl-carrier-protein] synthase-3
MPNAIIESVASYLPSEILTNEALAADIGVWTADEIYRKTGILCRHIAAPDQCASDLAVEAAKRLFAKTSCDPAAIDFVLFCTQSPDYYLPTSACLIQERLGLPRHCGALDFNQGCSGYVMGLSLAKGLIESGQARRVLLLTAETYSKYIHPQDPSVRTLFGDAAAATLIGAAETDAGLGDFIFGTDGRGGKNLIVQTGGHRNPRAGVSAEETTDREGNARGAEHLFMNGPEIFRFAVTEVPRTVTGLLAKACLTLEDLDYLILHQANQYMLDQLVKRIGIARDKAPYEFQDVGNTVSSTIPIVIERLLDQGRLSVGQRLMLVGFGVGYSWAGCIVQWQSE